MIREWVRTYGLFVGGVSMFVGGGLATIYGLLFFYVTAPGGPDPNRVVGPLNDLVLAVVGNQLFVPLALVGLGVFFADVYRNGLLDLDDRTYWERKKDLRRRKARESEVWDPPPEDQEEPTVYDELVEQVESGELALVDHDGSMDGRPSVRGVVRNTSPKPYRDVEVEIAFVDRQGGVVDVRLPSTERVESASSWKFEVFYTEPDDTVVTYKISPPEGTQVDGI